LLSLVPRAHRLEVLADRDLRWEAAAVGLGQPAVGDAPLMFVISAGYARTERRYRARGRYAQLEQATSDRTCCCRRLL